MRTSPVGKLITVEPSTIPLPDESDRKFYDAAKTSGAYLITGNLQHYPQDELIVSPKTFIDTACKFL